MKKLLFCLCILLCSCSNFKLRGKFVIFDDIEKPKNFNVGPFFNLNPAMNTDCEVQLMSEGVYVVALSHERDYDESYRNRIIGSDRTYSPNFKVTNITDQFFSNEIMRNSMSKEELQDQCDECRKESGVDGGILNRFTNYLPKDSTSVISELLIIAFIDAHRFIYWSSDNSEGRFFAKKAQDISDDRQLSVELSDKRWDKNFLRGYYILEDDHTITLNFETAKEDQFLMKGAFSQIGSNPFAKLTFTDVSPIFTDSNQFDESSYVSVNSTFKDTELAFLFQEVNKDNPPLEMLYNRIHVDKITIEPSLYGVKQRKYHLADGSAIDEQIHNAKSIRTW